MRRKVLILYDAFDTEGDTAIGVPWESDAMALQDFFALPNKFAVMEKWVLIQKSLEAAAGASATDSLSLLYVSHVSASVGVDPIVVAAGPPPDGPASALPGMNDVLGEYLEDAALAADDDKEVPRRTGVVILDFPGQRIVDAVIRRNPPPALSLE